MSLEARVKTLEIQVAILQKLVAKLTNAEADEADDAPKLPTADMSSSMLELEANTKVGGMCGISTGPFGVGSIRISTN